MSEYVLISADMLTLSPKLPAARHAQLCDVRFIRWHIYVMYSKIVYIIQLYICVSRE